MAAKQTKKVERTPVSSGALSAPVLQRRCAGGGSPTTGAECEDCKKKDSGTLQRKTASVSPQGSRTAPPIVHDVLRSPGQPLDRATRAFFEPRFGHDFSRVRIHTDEKAMESARAVNALAYTVGNDIAFASAQYAPHAPSGRKLLAHELTHVVQQRGAVTASAGATAIAPENDPLERHANNSAIQVLGDDASARPLPSFLPTGTLQRQTGAGGGSSAPAKTRPEVIHEAEIRYPIMIILAEDKLQDLITAFSASPQSMPKWGFGRFLSLAPVLDAVTEILKVEPGDANTPVRAKFLATLRKAIELMRKNLALTMPVQGRPDTDPECVRTGTPYCDSSSPGHILCCDAFFNAGPECQADVLIHERFHKVGLQHGDPDIGKYIVRPNQTTEQALNHADDMTQLISRIVRGTMDACPGGR